MKLLKGLAGPTTPHPPTWLPLPHPLHFLTFLAPPGAWGTLRLYTLARECLSAWKPSSLSGTPSL